MVESNVQLDHLFQALADGTRRDILKRVTGKPLSISELAQPYRMSFAAIAKHVSVLERARLVTKERRGKKQMIVIAPGTIDVAQKHLDRYAAQWNERYDKLEALLEKTNQGHQET